MKTVISAALLVAGAFSLPAQVTVTLKPLPGGGNQVVIRNDGTVPLTAYAIVLRQKIDDRVLRAMPGHPTDLPARFYLDAAMDLGVTPLAPNEERTVARSSELVMQGPSARSLVATEQPSAARRSITFEEPIVSAGIFAGGATSGDPVLLSRLMLRRSNMLLAVETSLDALSDAGSHNVPRDRLIDQFRKMAEFVNHWYIPQEEQVGRTLNLSIIDRLLHVPEGPLGSPFPPTAFVERETALLRQQRAVLAESQPRLEDAARSR